MSRKAPYFQLADQDGVIRKLSDYSGKWLVVYFYPKDNSPGCTTEACAFRDEHAILTQFGNTAIVGIDKSSVASHKSFATKHRLNFPLLSDPTHEITEAYGAWKTGKVRSAERPFPTRRNTYLINPKGEIVKEYLGITPKNHALDIIADLRDFQDSLRTKKLS